MQCDSKKYCAIEKCQFDEDYYIYYRRFEHRATNCQKKQNQCNFKTIKLLY